MSASFRAQWRLFSSRERHPSRRLRAVKEESGEASAPEEAQRFLREVIAKHASQGLTAKQLLQQAVVLAVSTEEERRNSAAAPSACDSPPDLQRDVTKTSLSSYSDMTSLLKELRPNPELQVAPVRLLRGSWVLKRAEEARMQIAQAGDNSAAVRYVHRKYKLPRRQDLEQEPSESEAFLSVEEVLNLEMNNKGLDGHEQMAVVSVSHAWETREHPDPRCATLLQLADAITRAQTKPMNQMRKLPKEVAIFYDWVSLFQWPRTANEETAFRHALSTMQVWYSHAMTTSVLVTNPCGGRADTSTPPPRPYGERGWPTFERGVSMFNKRGRGRLYWPSLIDTGDADGLARREAPLPPEEMEALLEAKFFTNGKSDRSLVLELYKETGRVCIQEAVSLNYEGLDWDDAQLEMLCRWLPRCANAVRLVLANNHISDRGVAALLGAVSATPESTLPALKQLQLHGNIGITEAGNAALADGLRAGAFPGLKRLTVNDDESRVLSLACQERQIDFTQYDVVDAPWEGVAGVTGVRKLSV